MHDKLVGYYWRRFISDQIRRTTFTKGVIYNVFVSIIIHEMWFILIDICPLHVQHHTNTSDRNKSVILIERAIRILFSPFQKYR